MFAMIRRVVLTIVGGLLLILGLLLALPLVPGPGLLIAVLGLLLLANEYAWAENMLHKTKQTLAKPLQKLNLPHHWHNWHYKNTFLLLVSIGLIWWLADTQTVRMIIESVGTLGYIGAVIAGMLFVSTFTIAPAILLLYQLAEQLDPLEVALLAGAGAVIGDYIIFRFLRDEVFGELGPLANRLGGQRIKRLFMTPYFAWLTPVIGALVIASPLPDEVGVGMMGASKLRNWQFLVLSFILNAVGIFLTVLAAKTF